MSKFGYQKVKLKELCKITVGHVGPMVKEYTDSGIPFLRSQNILPYKLDLSNIKFISQDFHKKLKKSALFPGDIVIVRTGYPGTACVIPSNLQELNCSDLVIIKKSKSFNSLFLSYIFNSTWGKQNVRGNLVGVAQQHFNVSAAQEMVIDLPPIEIQNKIALIISSYNDLIEKNENKIKLLEELARLIYHEWFVNYRFPGNENVKRVDSELGQIPELWEIVSFTNISEVLSGGTPRTTESEYWGGEIPFFTPSDALPSFFVRGTAKSITDLGLTNCNSKLFPSNTVFITARGTVGKVVLNSVDMAMSQSNYALVGKNNVTQYFLFFLTKHSVDQIKQSANGAVFDTIVVDTFNNLPVVKPPIELIMLFEKEITPFMEGILNLEKENEVLKNTRDFLLPRLISGQIDVSDLDISVYDSKEVTV